MDCIKYNHLITESNNKQHSHTKPKITLSSVKTYQQDDEILNKKFYSLHSLNILRIFFLKTTQYK